MLILYLCVPSLSLVLCTLFITETHVFKINTLSTQEAYFLKEVFMNYALIDQDPLAYDLKSLHLYVNIFLLLTHYQLYLRITYAVVSSITNFSQYLGRVFCFTDRDTFNKAYSKIKQSPILEKGYRSRLVSFLKLSFKVE